MIELNIRSLWRERGSTGEARRQMPTDHVGPPPRPPPPPHSVSCTPKFLLLLLLLIAVAEWRISSNCVDWLNPHANILLVISFINKVDSILTGRLN